MAGSLSQIRPGVFKLRVYAGLDARGKERAKSVTFETKLVPGTPRFDKLVTQHTAALYKAIEEGAKNKGTVSELVDLWVAHRAAKDSPATIYRRRSIVAQIKKDLGHHRLDALKPLHIDQWYDDLRTTPLRPPTKDEPGRYRTEATVHHYHRVLHAILEQGYVWEMTERTPAHRATAPKRRSKKQTSPKPAVVHLLINAATPDLSVAARVLAASGLRRGELVALRWTDLVGGKLQVRKGLVDLPKQAVVVKAPKTEASVRDVSLDADTLQVLQDHRAKLHDRSPMMRQDGYMFPDLLTDPTGMTPRRPSWFSKAWKALNTTHGAKVRLHDLRHFHATELLNGGTAVTSVSARLGHDKASTTVDIYGHGTDDSDEQAAETIALALKPGTQVPPPESS